jgi:4-amino-4-deoxy-L-arabinose transferase-like glycosyltransferase
VLVGLAFNTKSLAALLVVPGIAVGYLVCAPGSWRRRLRQLAVAGVVFVAVAVSWSLAVDLTPASQRPFVGSTSANTEFQLEFGYNGFGRVGGQQGGPGSTKTYLTPARRAARASRRERPADRLRAPLHRDAPAGGGAHHHAPCRGTKGRRRAILADAVRRPARPAADIRRRRWAARRAGLCRSR